MLICEMVYDAHETSKSKGWWDGQRPAGWMDRELVLKTIPEKLALIHSEVSEALEDYRESKLDTVVNEKGKPEGFPSELADIIIRVADLAGALDIDLEAEVERKLAYNKTRPHRHGGKVC